MKATQQGLWLRWLPTFIGFIAGGEIATLVAGPVDSLSAALFGGLLAGSVIGTGQWLVLRGRLPNAIWWIPATAVGQSLGLAAGAAIVGYNTELSDLIVQGAVTGLGIGVLQAVLLARVNGAGYVWAVATPALWALGWTATWAFGVDVEAQYTNFGLAGAVTVSALSGLLLTRLLGPSASQGSLVPVSDVAA